MVSKKIGMALLGMMTLIPAVRGFGRGERTPAHDGGEERSQTHTAHATADYTMPFELESGFLIVVQGRIGPMTKLRFALDTGTTHSMIDAKIADRLGLTLRQGSVLNFDRDIRISWTTVPELCVGELSLKNARVMVGNLHQLTEFTEGLDGVLGLDALRMTQGITINFETKLVGFRVNRMSPPTPSQALQQQAVLVRLDVQGRPLRLVLDTGARDIFLFENRVRKHAPALKWTCLRRNNRSGPLVAKIAARSEFRVGEREIQSVFLMRKAPETLPEDIDGYLGLSALNARYVEMDLATQVLNYVERSPRGMVRASAEEKGQSRGANEMLATRVALATLR